MHVASTIIFEGAAPSHDEFRDHIESRLHLVPRFRQKLRFVPFGQGRPVWVDDPHLNLDYHVRHTALPAPGSEEQLRKLGGADLLPAARPHQAALGAVAGRGPRRRPLRDRRQEPPRAGRRRLRRRHHHRPLRPRAETAGARRCAPPQWAPRPEPTDLQLLGEALRERATSPREIVRGVRAALRGPRQVLARRRRRPAKMLGAGMSAPSTPFNVDIGPHRRFAFVRTDLAELKQVKDEHGGTVNDVILSVVAGALGRYLRARGHDTEGLELRAMVPVSVRAEDEHGALGNRVSAMMAPLPVWCEDPVERLQIVTETMGDLKGSGQAVGAEILTKLTDFAPPTIAAQAARLQPAQRFFNLVVTNVPGPQFPLYVLGRRMERSSRWSRWPAARRSASGS